VLNVTESVFDEYYWSDTAFFTSLHDEGVVDVFPRGVRLRGAQVLLTPERNTLLDARTPTHCASICATVA
jgi:hypothetical protein